MSDNTTPSSPDNFSNNCSLDDGEVEYASYDDALSSAEAPSVGKQRENGEKRETTGK